MPRDNSILCVHCNTYMTRVREQQHRKLANAPFDLAPPTFVSQLQPVVDAGSDHEDTISNDNVPMGMDSIYDDAMDVDVDPDGEDGQLGSTATPCQDPFEYHWGSAHRATVESDDEQDSEDEDEMDVDEEGANDGEWDEEYIDWADIEAHASGLSAWDRLGESFENEAATTGK